MQDPSRSTSQVFGPVFIPAKTLKGNSWNPVYPDHVRPKTSVLAAAVPFFFFTFALAQLPVPHLSWGPNYPSKIDPPQGIHASRAPFLSRFDYPQPAAPLLSWSPKYPEAARGTPQAPVGWYVQPLREPDDIARLGWRGYQPNWLPLPRVESTGWYARPTQEPPDIARYGWGGAHPDWLAPKSFSAALGPAYSAYPGLIVVIDVATFGWRGIQPTQVDRLRVPTGWMASPLLVVQDVSPYAWQGVYPAQIDRRRSDHTGWFARPPFPPDVSGFAWRGVYPADLVRARWIAPYMAASVLHPRPFPTPTGWDPVYPLSIFRPRLVQSIYTISPYPVVVVTAMDWLPIYSDWIARRSYHATLRPCTFRFDFPIRARGAGASAGWGLAWHGGGAGGSS